MNSLSGYLIFIILDRTDKLETASKEKYKVSFYFDVSQVFFQERLLKIHSSEIHWKYTWKYKLFGILFILHNFLFCERILVLLPSKTDKLPCAS